MKTLSAPVTGFGSICRIEISSLLCNSILSMIVLELKSKLGSSISWVTSHMGTLFPISNICNTLNLLKESVTWLVKRLALSQEMLFCLRARSTHSEGSVLSKLVERCSVALEGVCTSKETVFKLCSWAVVNNIVH